MPASLSRQEAALFTAISGLLADGSRIELDTLRVMVGSQGFELGRTYLALRSQHLLAEQKTTPGFFRRLFGARVERVVYLTEAGQALARSSTKAALPEPEAVPEQPASQTAHTVPAVEGVAETAKPKPAAPSAQTRKKARATPTPIPAEFTEVLGGAPIDPVSIVRDPIRLEGLAEMLGLTGFEISPAGEMLAERRWAEGRRDSEVALEILLVAVAHAVHLEGLGMARLDKEAIRQFFVELEKGFARLAVAGELSQSDLASNLETVYALLGPSGSAHPRLAAILQDPLLGMAPPATCPEDFFLSSQDAEA